MSHDLGQHSDEMKTVFRNGLRVEETNRLSGVVPVEKALMYTNVAVGNATHKKWFPLLCQDGETPSTQLHAKSWHRSVTLALWTCIKRKASSNRTNRIYRIDFDETAEIPSSRKSTLSKAVRSIVEEQTSVAGPVLQEIYPDSKRPTDLSFELFEQFFSRQYRP